MILWRNLILIYFKWILDKIETVRLLIKGMFLKQTSRDMTKPTKWPCAQRRLRPAWASAQSDQSSLSAWRQLGSFATHWAHREDSDQTGWMPRLIWVFDGRTLILLVLSCRSSDYSCAVCIFEKIVQAFKGSCQTVFRLDTFLNINWNNPGESFRTCILILSSPFKKVEKKSVHQYTISYLFRFHGSIKTS